jgi:hypothetical protein
METKQYTRHHTKQMRIYTILYYFLWEYNCINEMNSISNDYKE